MVMQHGTLRAKYSERELAAVRDTKRISERLIHLIAEISIHKMHLENLLSHKVCCLQRQ